MPKYTITATYEYATSSPIEAENEDKAYKIFLDDLNSYYQSTEDLDIEEVEVCEECDEELDECECEDGEDN
jgi:hypothetical protein